MSINAPIVPRIVSASFSVSDKVGLTLYADKSQSMSVSANVQVVYGKSYDGEYVATPGFDDQVFLTNGLVMADDFTVREIPIHESPNEFGTTFTIGV